MACTIAPDSDESGCSEFEEANARAHSLAKTTWQTLTNRLNAYICRYKEEYGRLLRDKAQEPEAAKLREKQLMQELAAGETCPLETVAMAILAHLEAQQAVTADELNLMRMQKETEAREQDGQAPLRHCPRSISGARSDNGKHCELEL